MKSFDVYLDSDVIVSSCLSSVGAAYLLLEKENLVRFYTDIQKNELRIVIDRLNIAPKILHQTLKKCTLVPLKSPHLDLFSKYTLDVYDRHIIAGVVASKAKYLITYNLKHFRIDAIKRDLNITVLSPAQFLQFLRSLKQL